MSTPYLSIEWNGSVFVLVDSSSSTYKYSYNGISWANATVPAISGANSANKPYNAKWLGDKMVITGNLKTTTQGNVIITSPDGIYYSITKTENGVQLRDVETNLEYRNRIVFPHTVTLAVGGVFGENITTYTKIAYSLDNGTSWNKSTNASAVFSVSANDAFWNGRIWVAVGEGTGNTIAISTNGETWQGCGTNMFTRASGIQWSNEQNKFVAVGIGAYNVATSVDGIYWLGQNIPGMNEGKVVEWNGEIWVVAGKPLDATNKSIAYSSDGNTWVPVPGMFTTDVSNIEWKNGYWTVYGLDGLVSKIATSSNGKTWTISTSSISPTPFYNDILYFSPTTTANTYSTSVDNSTWTTNNAITDLSMSKVIKFTQNTSTQAVANIQPLTIATGEGTNTLAYSADGIFWTGLGSNVFTTRANKSVWNGKIWVAVGIGGNWVATSYDGLIWTGRENTIFEEGYDVAWNGTLFIAVGNKGTYGTSTIASSSDGIYWNPISNSVNIFSFMASGIAWTGRLWLAYGSGDGSGGNTTAFSNDGITWSSTSPKNAVIENITSVFGTNNYFPNTTTTTPITLNSYTTSSSSNSGTGAVSARAFDNDVTTFFRTAINYNTTTGAYIGTTTTTYDGITASGDWIQLQIPSSVVIKYYQMTLSTAGRSPPKSWILLGSINGTKWTFIHQYTSNSNTKPNNLYNINLFTLWFNLLTNTVSYNYYRVVFLYGYANGTAGLSLTSCDFFTESGLTNTLSVYRKPIVLKNNVLFTIMSNTYTLADLSLNVLNPPTNGGSFVSSYLYDNTTNYTITSSCFDGERYFITDIGGNVLYMNNESSNTNLNFDVSFGGTNINSGLTRLYGSCWNQQFVLFAGGTGTNTGGITYGRLGTGSTSSTWKPTNASQLFTTVYGVSSNSGYGFTYIPNAVYLNTNEILRVVGPKSYSSPGETAVKFNLRNSNMQ